MSRFLPFSLISLIMLVSWLEAVEVPEARQLIEKGHYQEAEVLLKKRAPDTDPRVLRILLDLAKRKGKQGEVERYAQRLLQLYREGELKSSETIAQAAYAAWQLERWKEANRLFLEASQEHPPPQAMFVDWGNLYLEKYNAAEAESIFRDAIRAQVEKGKPELGAAYVGLARALRAQSKMGSDDALTKTLEFNPRSLEALTVYASMALEGERWEEARSWIRKGLSLNSSYLPLLELESVFYYLRGETDHFEEMQERILRINPRNGDLFEKLGEMAVVRRRLEEAVGFYRESLRRNPRQWSALASLGINLLRLGNESEGKHALEQAYVNDPYNVWTVNTLRLLDSLDRFAQYETAHFSIRLHSKEAEVLRPYVEELVERCLATLERKYGHRVSGKYFLELYRNHEDLAVRALGLPGLGALGATFGRIVAMDSPSARPKGRFHWGSTLWHEVAHVVTLSLSRHKVPRWFTEGISIMEERQAAPGWGQSLTLGFLEAYKRDQLLPLADLNSGFVRAKSARQIENSYYQAGWVCQFLASRYGFEKIPAMLIAFGEGKGTEAVFDEVLGSSLEEIDGQFKQEVDRVLQPVLPRVDSAVLTSVSVPGQEPDPEVLLQELKKNPENYFLNLHLGKTLHALGRGEEAISYLEKALRLFPQFAGRESPYSLLSQIHLQRGDRDRATEVLRRWWKTTPRDAANALKLASLLLEAKQVEEAIGYLKEIVYLDPLEPAVHNRLGDLYLKTGRAEEAVREFRVLQSLAPVDLASARYRLAEALYQCGRIEDARREVLLSLEVTPGYEQAQKLLLKLVRR